MVGSEEALQSALEASAGKPSCVCETRAWLCRTRRRARGPPRVGWKRPLRTSREVSQSRKLRLSSSTVQPALFFVSGGNPDCSA